MISNIVESFSLFLLRKTSFLFCNSVHIAQSLEQQDETGRFYISSYLPTPESEENFNREFDKRFFRRTLASS